MPETAQKKKFSLVLIKPSHYDDDGYVIQWFRSAIPSNSLAVLYGLALECAADKVLGRISSSRSTRLTKPTRVIRPKHIISLIEKADLGMVMLVGVQSNQFPRALDIAKPLTERGIQVAIGGFHVSGTISMLKDRDPHVQKAIDMGIIVFAGEAEGRLAQVLLDAAENDLQPVYNFMDDLPNIEGVATPLLPAERVHLTAGATTSFDAGRGCPFACSFCTIINVQGRKSRRRSPDDIEEIVRVNVEQGLHSFFITDDNFARNKDWEPILDRLIYLREVEKLKISFIIQVDTLCHKLPNFIEKSRRAGVKRVFIGLENINPDSLLGASKRQNKITDYREMLLAWKKAGIVTYCGYILGFPGDTKESITHDIEIIKERTAGRSARILLPDAAAGFGRSQETARSRHRDGRGPEQIRPQPRRHRAREDVARGMGRHLSFGLENLLYRRACRNRAPPRYRDRHQPRQNDVLYRLVQRLYRHRGHPPARRRLPPA